MESPSIKQLIIIAQQVYRLAAMGKQATEEGLADLRQAMAAEQPEFMAWLQTIGGELTERNRNLCLLVRLGFEPYEMINLFHAKRGTTIKMVN